MYDIIVISGGFDILHEGHLSMIQQARKRAWKVIVGVNSDAWLERKKGYAFLSFEHRKKILQSIKGVYRVLSFNDDDGTACRLLDFIRTQYPSSTIAFGNGGDRNAANVPQITVCGNLNIDMLWGLGGDQKLASSTRLAENVVEKICKTKEARQKNIDDVCERGFCDYEVS